MKKRPDISKLTVNRSMYFKIGLIVALSFCILAFNYTSYEITLPTYEVTAIEEYSMPEIIRTQHEKPPVTPPPAMEVAEEIIEAEEVEFIEEPEPEVTETPIVEKPVKVVAAPPAPVVPKKAAPVLKPAIEETVTEEPPIFVIVEEMPRFGNCTDENTSKEARRLCSDQALLSYLYKNIRYPTLAKENGIDGTVYLEFIIDEKGKVTEAKIVKDIGGQCGTEALRVIESMPNWSPGRQRNRPVKVKMTLPIKFQLE